MLNGTACQRETYPNQKGKHRQKKKKIIGEPTIGKGWAERSAKNRTQKRETDKKCFHLKLNRGRKKQHNSPTTYQVGGEPLENPTHLETA